MCIIKYYRTQEKNSLGSGLEKTAKNKQVCLNGQKLQDEGSLPAETQGAKINM